MNTTNNPHSTPDSDGADDTGKVNVALDPGAAQTSTRSPTSQVADRSGKAGISDVLAQATTLLRQHTDAGWKAIEDTVMARALTLFRPSAPVRARHDSGDFFLASDIVVARLRQVIDDVPQAAAQQIVCITDDRDELELVTIQLIAAYGASLLDLATRVHVVALGQFRELLGALAPSPAQVRTHVHIVDVSNDPRIVN